MWYVQQSKQRSVPDDRVTLVEHGSASLRLWVPRATILSRRVRVVIPVQYSVPLPSPCLVLLHFGDQRFQEALQTTGFAILQTQPYEL
jgi:hypothetical protein